MSAKPKKTEYIPPHLRTKLPPKEITGEDIQDALLFPTLKKVEVVVHKPILDFSRFMKETVVKEEVVVINRQVLATHPLTSIRVVEMSNADLRMAKRIGENMDWDIGAYVPRITIDTHYRILDEYDIENQSPISVVSEFFMGEISEQEDTVIEM
jgi:hypothetical protein